jgi:hypothetical protein
MAAVEQPTNNTSRNVQLRRLTPDDLEELILLERKIYPEGFHIHTYSLENQLKAASLKGRNYSVGAFNNAELVGYMVVLYFHSELDPSRELLRVTTMAVQRTFRRSVVIQLLTWMMREAAFKGGVVEAGFRETTSYRMILRNNELIKRFGFRVTTIAPGVVVANEQLIFIRFEHVFFRDPILRPFYTIFTKVCRFYDMVAALPRRILRRICTTFGGYNFPLWLRQFALLNDVHEALGLPSQEEHARDLP